VELVNIDSIKQIYKTIKKVDHHKYSQLKKSIQMYGQLKPIIVNESLEIIDGHLIFKSMKELNLTDVYIKKLKIENSAEFRLSYNSLSFELDQIQFLKELNKLEIDKSNHIFPYTNEEIERYKKLFLFDWDQYKKPIKKKIMF
jgi:hypothetical protein